MNFNEYQSEALKTAQYPNVGVNLVYPAMGLAGEAGEFCDKIKKFWRNTGFMSGGRLTSLERNEVVKELGDVLWYIAAAAEELGVAMETVAELNLHKLHDRKARGVIKGAGDNR